MKNIKTFISIAAFSVLVMGLPAIASAQWGGQNDPYGRNNRNGNNGGYGNNGRYNGDVQSAIQDLKYRTRQFEQQTDNNDRYNQNGRRGNGNSVEDLADDLKKAADRLEDKFGRGRNMNNSRSEAQRVVNLGSQIASAMGRSRNNGYNGNEWYAIDNDIRIIANAYGLNYYTQRNSRFPSGNGNGRGNNRNNLPSWWPF